MKVLVMGIATGLARALAQELTARGHSVMGIDRRGWLEAPRAIKVFQVDLRKRAAEDVFRKEKPDCVVHMATLSALAAETEERHRINVGGTRAVFEHCQTYGIGQLVFVGRHTYYGASAESAMYHSEDEPPQALAAFPELSDLVAADLYASNALWRNPKMTTAVLRMVYTLGPSRQGTLAGFLRGKRTPMVLGYDPLFQFLWESDAVDALVLAIEKKLRGVFNVAGPPPLPLRTIVRETGRTPVPLPEPILRSMLGRFGFPSLPRGALEHIKFPIVVDSKAFATATGFKWAVDEVDALSRFRAIAPPPA
jgi:UDP-glucose 4-epimerase